MTGKELMACQEADILTCNMGSLINLPEVRVPADLPLPQRTEQYLDQVHNPYLFRVNKLIVKVSFNGTRDLPSKLTHLMTQ